MIIYSRSEPIIGVRLNLDVTGDIPMNAAWYEELRKLKNRGVLLARGLLTWKAFHLCCQNGRETKECWQNTMKRILLIDYRKKVPSVQMAMMRWYI